MIRIDADDVRRLLSWSELVEALRAMFAAGCDAPPRLHFNVPVGSEPNATLLLMPAWRVGHYLGVKLVTVFPGNVARGASAVSGIYLLADGRTGEFIAEIDGGELTARRTAAASVLAASYLARVDARTLVVIGTGRICRNLVEAYCSVWPIERVLVYGRTPNHVEKFVQDLSRIVRVTLQSVSELGAALAEADIVSAATLSTEPLIEGRFLRLGVHVDLVGGFRDDMREPMMQSSNGPTAFSSTRLRAPRGRPGTSSSPSLMVSSA